MKLVEKLVTGTARTLAVAGLTMLLVFATFVLLDGLLRAIANHPLDFVREIGDLVAAVCGACCLPIVLLHRGNFNVRLFEKLLPPIGVRVIDVIADTRIAIIMIGMTWQFYLFGMKTARANDVTWFLSVPKAPFWFVVDAALSVATAVQLFVLVRVVLGVRPARGSASTP
jgi:TRAP-type C4-dicarboxylate transport system permease small subunit